MYKITLYNCCLVLFYLCLISCSSSKSSESVSSAPAEYGEYPVTLESEIVAPAVATDDYDSSSSMRVRKTASTSAKSKPTSSYDAIAEPPTATESDAIMHIEEKAKTIPITKKREPAKQPKKLPKAGLITAGEWNDLQNWADWTELNEKEAYNQYKDVWGFNVEGKNSISLLNKDHFPIVDQEVKLYDSKANLIWNSFTDNVGKVELWAKAFDNTTSLSGAYLKIGKKKIPLESLENDPEKGNIIYLDQKCTNEKNVDIMFVVDATGSMTDEINFLKSELIDVLQKVKTHADEINLRTASVFYKDKGDNYLTIDSPFTTDSKQTIEWIRQRSASGGGDSPEAVEAGLAKALEMDWSENARTRLLFLLLDAPPHKRDKVQYQQLVKRAAEKGIKIIPISASGIERETEFLLKYTSILTNGTYVFITDDSGIGNPHLTPVVKDFEVELLNNLLVRVISNYAKGNDCQEQQIETVDLSMKIFPNPASMLLNLEIGQDVDEVRITGPSGKLMIKQKALIMGQHQIDISQLVDGLYQLSIIKGDQICTEKMIVVNKA